MMFVWLAVGFLLGFCSALILVSTRELVGRLRFIPLWDSSPAGETDMADFVLVHGKSYNVNMFVGDSEVLDLALDFTDGLVTINDPDASDGVVLVEVTGEVGATGAVSGTGTLGTHPARSNVASVEITDDPNSEVIGTLTFTLV